MKKILILLLFFPSWVMAFDFSAKSPSGHTLFYEIHGKSATVVFPKFNESENTCYYGYDEPKGDLIIPEIVRFNEKIYSIDTIGYAAFARCSEITSVVLPNSVKVLSSYAFADCSKLHSITIGSQLNKIEDNAFYNDYGLIEARYNGSIESWCRIDFSGGLLGYEGNLYFNNTLLTELVIPRGVYEIKDAAFRYVSCLKHVVLPKSIKRIGAFAFYGCKNLVSINIPDGINRINSSTFSWCENLQKINIPSSVSYIGQSAFSDCKKLKSIALPKQLDSIESFAFSKCTSLEEVDIYPSVSYIGMKAFDQVGEIVYRGVAEGSPWGAKHRRIPTDYWHVVYSSRKEIQSFVLKENDGITGIYQDISSNLEVGVIKEKDKYKIVYVGGKNNGWWKEGDLQGTLTASATYGLFRGKWINNDFSVNDNCYVAFTGAAMELMINDTKVTFLKMFPSGTTNDMGGSTSAWSGTGFALGNGYLVTNQHVIDGATTISIKGVGGDLNTGYNAEVVANDKTNDIAVLKINDSRFKGLGAIPYAVYSRIADKGEGVFVLGYPMTQVLGNEVKYTAGEINSRTGFQGDVTTYQISAPVTHGNSGGPMFDSKGNVIGIINSGITDKEIAENVGYAIKISYLKILIESAGLNITLPGNNTISNLSKQEMIKKVEKFVYYIECSK